MIPIPSNPITKKAALGSKPLVVLMSCALALLEPSQTTLLLANSGCDSFLAWTSPVHVQTILSKLEDTFFTIVKDSLGTGTQEEIL